MAKYVWDFSNLVRGEFLVRYAGDAKWDGAGTTAAWILEVTTLETKFGGYTASRHVRHAYYIKSFDADSSIHTHQRHGQTTTTFAFAPFGGCEQPSNGLSFHPVGNDHILLEGSINQGCRHQHGQTICSRPRHIILAHHRLARHFDGYAS